MDEAPNYVSLIRRYERPAGCGYIAALLAPLKFKNTPELQYPWARQDKARQGRYCKSMTQTGTE
jgi:hypothetical protein